MESMATLLARLGLLIIRFDFDYRRQMAITGKRRPPDKMPVLISRLQAEFLAAQAAYPELSWFVGGKSMGGRVARTAGEQLPELVGVVCFGYPFHPPKKPENLRLEPLQQISPPTLVAQGTRDPLGDESEVNGYALAESVELFWLADGDHDLKPRVRSGYTHEQHLAATAERVVAFCRGLI